ncbi:hypothetical protein AMS68_005934 [Peltaster fructicola]|uniref:Uncharacterized protein n=1 Tax=Peltaster fructicola TaxID=286661 RepID=A0A6H0Y087_9PEZI|nr:hypothetical protein AMS68_005934 [Peltaster fructicola]
MSMSQPVYRRPSWAQHEKSYETYTRHDSIISRTSSNSPDFGPENFSYDPTYVPQFKLPDSVLKDRVAFPQILRVEVSDWALAGAALCTALDRIARLKKEAIERGWPRGKTYAHLSRSGSVGSPASVATQSDAGSPVTSPMMLPASITADRFPHTADSLTPLSSAESSANVATGILAPRSTPKGVESPPVSPKGSSTPAYASNDAKAVLPDLSKLPVDLSPRVVPVSGTQTPGSLFDENAWETYTKSFDAELSDIRSHAWGRFKGFARTIDRLVVEYSNSTEFKAGIAAFDTWWNTMKPKMAEYEERVKTLQAPDLEQVKMARAELGLPV